MTDPHLPPARDLPPRRREAIRRLLTTEDAVPRRRLPRLLVPALAAAAVVVLVVGTALAFSLFDRGGSSGDQEPAPEPAPAPETTPTWGPDNAAPLERCEVVDNEECSLIQQQLDERKLARSDSTPEERCLREIRRPSDGGSVDGAFGGGSIDEKRARAVLTVPHDKGETIVFSDGASWIACDTGTDTVTLLQVRSLDPEPLGLANLEISINVLTAPVDPWGPAWKSLEDSFGKVVNDYHFGVGRVPAGVSSLTWRFNYRKEPTETVEAEFRDGYWVMQHLTEPHRRIFDRATVTATYDDGRTEEFRLFEWTSPPDFDHICAQINHGC